MGLLFGYLALYSKKGGPLHRKAGLVFVYVMVATAIFGMVMAAVRGVAPAINLPAGAITATLVVTALTTVRPPFAGSSGLAIGAMLVSLGVGLCSLVFGVEAVANGGMRKGMPAFPFFMFAIVGLLASLGDLRVLRSGPLRGPYRLARHLWRMCFALFIAALSFFIGQAQVFPKPIRIYPLLAFPMLAALVTMLYWLWRVRVRRSTLGIVVAPIPLE